MRHCWALVVIALAPGCGGSSAKHVSSTTAGSAAVRVTISARTHHPKVNKLWPVTVRVTDGSGRPLPARLTMRILFGGTPVGKVDNGRVYRFVGTWRERRGNEITWPPASRGQPLTFQVIVTARGKKITRGWAIKVP
jgi:hypothetical protein